MEFSLSKYYPIGTSYFYGYPAGQDSNFFNSAPAWVDQLVADRPLICAGAGVRVVTFAPTTERRIVYLLDNEDGDPPVKRENTIELPKVITAETEGIKRNTLIKQALLKLIEPGTLVMAQPYLDKTLRHLYLIPPVTSNWFNDKKNMVEYIPHEYLAPRYGCYKNGKEFSASTDSIPFPCVVKVSSSCSGDGVRICRSTEDLTKARQEYTMIKGNIFIEAFIEAVYNLGVQFGVPSDPREPIEIVGINQQIVTDAGEYLGGMLTPSAKLPSLTKLYRTLVKVILPYVREKGWYGLGGFDVLIDSKNNFTFIDSNFRMTAMTAYLCQMKNDRIHKPIATFTGIFRGSDEEFEDSILPLATPGSEDRKIYISTLAKLKDSYRFNAGMLFKSQKEIPYRAKDLLAAGIESPTLERLSSTAIRPVPSI